MSRFLGHTVSKSKTTACTGSEAHPWCSNGFDVGLQIRVSAFGSGPDPEPNGRIRLNLKSLIRSLSVEQCYDKEWQLKCIDPLRIRIQVISTRIRNPGLMHSQDGALTRNCYWKKRADTLQNMQFKNAWLRSTHCRIFF